jgi:hypothetical protein
MGEETGNGRLAILPASDINRVPAPQSPPFPVPVPAAVPPFGGIIRSLGLIDEAHSLAETVSVTRQLLSSLFPRTPFLLGWSGAVDGGFSVLDGEGVARKAGALSPRAVAAFLGTGRVRRPLRLKGRIVGGSSVGSVTSFPLVSCGANLGFGSRALPPISPSSTPSW